MTTSQTTGQGNWADWPIMWIVGVVQTGVTTNRTGPHRATPDGVQTVGRKAGYTKR